MTLLLSIASLIVTTAGASGMPLLPAAQDLPEVEFFDEFNQNITLDKWLGKVVVLNIWATWCGPCREEMPTLDHLQKRLGSDHFEVVALSIDEAGVAVVRQFFDEIGIKNLPIYIDSTFVSARSLQALALPTTILINSKGQEIGRLVGPAKWDSPEMLNFFESIIEQH